MDNILSKLKGMNYFKIVSFKNIICTDLPRKRDTEQAADIVIEEKQGN